MKVMPRAKANVVVPKDGVLYVRTTAVAADGKANEAVVKLLAKHFDVPKSSITVVRGHTSRIKSIEVQPQ